MKADASDSARPAVGVLAGTDGDGWHTRDLARAGAELGVRVVPLGFPALESWLGEREGKAGAKHRCAGENLDELDALIVRTMPGGTLEQIIFRMDVLHSAEANGLRIVNPPRALEAAIDKHLASARLEAAGLPVPRARVTESADRALEFFDELGGDVVLKPIFGSEGCGQIRLRSAAAARRCIAELSSAGAVFYLQQFVAGPGHDWRVMTCRGRVLASMRRTPAPGQWQSNISRGGRAEAIAAPAAIEPLAIEAANALGTVVAGVDVVLDRDDRPWLLEVNGAPGWKALAATCGVDVARAVLDAALTRLRA